MFPIITHALLKVLRPVFFTSHCYHKETCWACHGYNSDHTKLNQCFSKQSDEATWDFPSGCLGVMFANSRGHQVTTKCSTSIMVIRIDRLCGQTFFNWKQGDLSMLVIKWPDAHTTTEVMMNAGESLPSVFIVIFGLFKIQIYSNPIWHENQVSVMQGWSQPLKQQSKTQSDTKL